MSEVITILAEIIRIERLNNSVNGNPRFRVTVEQQDNNNSIMGKTSTDSMFAYKMPEVGDIVPVSYRVTRQGNIIFIDM